MRVLSACLLQAVMLHNRHVCMEHAGYGGLLKKKLNHGDSVGRLLIGHQQICSVMF